MNQRASTPGRKRWSRLLASVVAVGACSSSSSEAVFEGDVYTSFRPTTDLFPTPPAPDTSIQTGTATPELSVLRCRPWRTATEEGEAASAWTSVRYDWTEDGEPKSWIIGVRTAAYQISPMDLKTEVDEAAVRCAAEAEDYWGDPLSGEVGDVPGLPPEIVTFEVSGGVSKVRSRPVNVLGATYIDARLVEPATSASAGDDDTTISAEPTHILAVYWIGWGTDVPVDQFAGLVRSLVDTTRELSDATVGLSDSSTALAPSIDTSRHTPTHPRIAEKERNNVALPA